MNGESNLGKYALRVLLKSCKYVHGGANTPNWFVGDKINGFAYLGLAEFAATLEESIKRSLRTGENKEDQQSHADDGG